MRVSQGRTVDNAMRDNPPHRRDHVVNLTRLVFCTPLLLTLAASAQTSAQRPVAERTPTTVRLANDRCRIEVSLETGDLTLEGAGPRLVLSEWFEVVAEDRTGLEPWEMWEHGSETPWLPGVCTAETVTEVDDQAAAVRVHWDRFPHLRVSVDIVLRTDAPGPSMRLTVNAVDGEALVDTIHFPRLRGTQIGASSEDDWFTWPHTLGALVRADAFTPGQEFRAAYPDFLYMQWLDLFDAEEDGGLYVGCLDDYGYNKELYIGRDATGSRSWGITFPGCWVATPGDAWTTPWVELVPHNGDWHTGADLYRPFAQAAFGPVSPPETVRDMPTAQCWLAHHAREADLGSLFEIQQQAPIHASYIMKGLNTSRPEGWDGFRGSGLEMMQAFEQVRSLGGSAALFTFDRAPFMGYPHFADLAGDWVLPRRDGSFREGFRDMMPSPFSDTLRAARTAEAVRLTRDLGLDEIHFDTAATSGENLAGPCYIPPGAGPRPNEIPHYFKRMYAEILAACREHNPEFTLRAEHCADFFFPEFLTSTAHFFETARMIAGFTPGTDARLAPELFAYTLPLHASQEMPSMSDDLFWVYGTGMGFGFHGGGPSWCFNPDVRDAEAPGGELLHRYRFYDDLWLSYYDFRVGFSDAVVVGQPTAEPPLFAPAAGPWEPCVLPAPCLAVTYTGNGREVTLGNWQDQEGHWAHFRKHVPHAPRPADLRLRVPTRFEDPLVRIHTATGVEELPATPVEGRLEIAVPAGVQRFAVEVIDRGPVVTVTVPPLTAPGTTATLLIRVRQREPLAGSLSVTTPAGWPTPAPVPLPAGNVADLEVEIPVPEGVFGRNYPIKGVVTTPEGERTFATHLRVMEPVTVLYQFRTAEQPAGFLVPGELDAELEITCVSNTPDAIDLRIEVSGPLVQGSVTARLDGIPSEELGADDGRVRRWIEQEAEVPGNAVVKRFSLGCDRVPQAPTRIRVYRGNGLVFDEGVFPRTQLMDLGGPWHVLLQRASQAQVAGIEAGDDLDMEQLTPSAWHGDWPVETTPIKVSEDRRKQTNWGVFRRMVYIPEAWQGADVQLRIDGTGAPWGQGGTLNIVAVNGWPAGRTWTRGDVRVAPYLVYGGWNLIAIASSRPNTLPAPLLFVRETPDPTRLKVAEAQPPPAGAFLLLGRRPTGQGLGQVFMRGVPEADHRRTDVARGGEHRFLYFTVADAFLFDTRDRVEITVEYLDRGTAPFGLNYDSHDPTAPVNGAFKDAPEVQRTDSGEWREHTFILEDARLANREHQGADFRLYAKDEDLRVRRVSVTAAQAD
jgi:hypothetical protein